MCGGSKNTTTKHKNSCQSRESNPGSLTSKSDTFLWTTVTTECIVRSWLSHPPVLTCALGARAVHANPLDTILNVTFVF